MAPSSVSKFHFPQFPKSMAPLSRKRKLQEANNNDDNNGGVFSMEDLNQDLLERVLSWLPASTLFRVGSVCKRWKSVSDSESFKLACSQVPSRDPWFFMVNPQVNAPVVFDSTERNWKKLNPPPCSSMPMAASGGLVCSRDVSSGGFVVFNPVTGSSSSIVAAPGLTDEPLHAIVMNTSSNYPSSYKIVLVYGEFPKLSFRVYNSRASCWEDESVLSRDLDNAMEIDPVDDDGLYFISKTGNIVATTMQRSPSKEYSSVMALKDGEEVVYFLSSSGTVVACNLARNSFSEYPRLLPVSYEYSIDLIESGGEMLVVVLYELLESASLRVWRYVEEARSWEQVGAMPMSMSHEFYGKKMDINCVGASGGRVLICLNSAELGLFRYVICDLQGDEWTELPGCYIGGEAAEFMSSFSFEPRIEAST